MRIPVINFNNQVVREVEVPDEIFACQDRVHLVHKVVVALRAGWRSGTHKVKGRGEVSGAGRKPFRQKGTGRARAGSIRSPLWRKGGTVHGPVPRDYSKRVSVAERKNALKSALSSKVKEQRLVVIEDFALESHKTSDLAKRLEKLGVSGKVLIVDEQGNQNLTLAARNLAAAKAVDALGVNVYDVVDRPYLLISEGALGRLVGVLSQ